MHELISVSLEKLRVLTVLILSMMGGDFFGKVLILSFKDDEEHIINRILSCMNKEIEILHHGNVQSGQLYFDGLCVDEQKRIVVRENNEIELTYTEFEILLLLAQNMGKVFSKEQIYDSVWKEPYFGDHNIVMSHIRNLRGKIEDNPSKPRIFGAIGTVILTILKWIARIILAILDTNCFLRLFSKSRSVATRIFADG